MIEKATEHEALVAVEGAAQWADQASDNLIRAIHHAREEGLSLRKIATAAHLSHEQIRRILSD